MTQHWTTEQIRRFDTYLQEAHRETAQKRRNRNPSSSSGTSSEQGHETDSSEIQITVNTTDMDDPEAVPWEEEDEPAEGPPDDWFLE